MYLHALVKLATAEGFELRILSVWVQRLTLSYNFFLIKDKQKAEHKTTFKTQELLLRALMRAYNAILLSSIVCTIMFQAANYAYSCSGGVRFCWRSYISFPKYKFFK